jgi:hypothetical protein
LPSSWPRAAYEIGFEIQAFLGNVSFFVSRRTMSRSRLPFAIAAHRSLLRRSTRLHPYERTCCERARKVLRGSRGGADRVSIRQHQSHLDEGVISEALT